MAAIGSTPFERGDEAEDFLIVNATADKGLVDIQRLDFRHWGKHPAGCAANRMRYAIRATSSLKNHCPPKRENLIPISSEAIKQDILSNPQPFRPSKIHLQAALTIATIFIVKNTAI